MSWPKEKSEPDEKATQKCLLCENMQHDIDGLRMHHRHKHKEYWSAVQARIAELDDKIYRHTAVVHDPAPRRRMRPKIPLTIAGEIVTFKNDGGDAIGNITIPGA
jgi:hypothetical protein